MRILLVAASEVIAEESFIAEEAFAEEEEEEAFAAAELTVQELPIGILDLVRMGIIEEVALRKVCVKRWVRIG